MTGVCRLNGDLSRLTISNLTHHDHIRILAQKMAQHMWKRATDVIFYMNLVDTLHLVFHWILHRHDTLVLGIDGVEKRVKRG